MKRIFLFLFTAICAANTLWAYHFQSGDLYYDSIGNGRVRVTYKDFPNSGDYIRLTKVTIPTSVYYKGKLYKVTGIDSYAFYKCTGLTSVTIPESVTSIEGSAFQDCSSLTSIKIPESVTSLGNSVFRGCKKLTSIHIHENITYVGRNAFTDCTALKSVTWNAKHCADIEDDGTKYTLPNSITSFAFGNEVEHIPSGLFCGVSGLTSLTIPNSVTSIGKYAFRGCTSLTSIIIPESITSIGNYAFAGWTVLTSLTIPESVMSIGGGAFYGCTGLTSVTIPNSVTSIGNWAFEDCTGLTSVTIPESVTSIGNGAFSGCTGLTSVTIPESVTSIRYNAFYGCSGLTSVTIPNSVTSIGESAFEGCSGLTSVSIGESVTSIGWSAFKSCTGLTSIVWNAKKCTTFSQSSPFEDSCPQITFFTFGDKVEHIPAYLCYDMSKLTSVVLPNNVDSIGERAFRGCSGLTSVSIGESVMSIGERAFAGCTGLTAITIPESVTSIGDYAFYGCSGLTSVSIPNNVDSIGGGAFEDCTGLTSISIGESVTSIGHSAFENCSGFTSVTIPNSVTSIGQYAFDGCTGLTSIIWNAKNCSDFKIDISGDNVNHPFYEIRSQITSFTFGDKVEHIPAYLCDRMSKLTSITIPESVTNIGYRAFRGCTGLTSISIGESVTSIGNDAFLACSGLTSATIPNSVTSIGNGAFQNCSGLTSVTIGNSVTSIGDRAFRSCSGLTSITIPSSVTSISGSTFTGCTGLISIVVENGNSVYDSRNNCNAIIKTETNALITGCQSTIIPESVTSIEDYAFYDCSGLTSVTIPNGVTSIGDYAFYGCTGITSVPISESVTSIGKWAFWDCTGLKSVIAGASIPPVTDDSFDYNILWCALYVPCGSLAAYQEADEWKKFQYIHEPPAPFSISVKANATQKGTARLESEPTCSNMEATISATSNHGYRFTHWSDGNTDNPRTIVLTQDTVLTAIFEMVTYEVSLSCNAEQGTVSGEGTYQEGKRVTISATPKTGYRFTHWSDGNTDNPRTIVLTQDTALTAYFEEIPTYAVSLSCDAEQGTVSGGGTYREGEQVSISATPNEGYEFVQWSDSNTDNPRSWIVTEDVSLSAIFQPVTALPQTTAASQETQKVVKDGQVLILRNGKAYDMLGQEIR